MPFSRHRSRTNAPRILLPVLWGSWADGERAAVDARNLIDLVRDHVDQGLEENGRGLPVGFDASLAHATFEVRFMATKRWSYPSSAVTSAMSI
jgi:hypothetical protein